MRGVGLLAGLVLLHVLVTAAGAALLVALGYLERRPRALVLALGPAFLAGIAVLGPALILLLVLGVGVGGLALLIVDLAVIVGLGSIGLRRPPRMGVAPPSPRPDVVLSRVVLAAVALYIAFGVSSLINLPTSFDDANIWSLRGLGIYFDGRLVDGIFRNPDFAYVHLDYPLLQPVLEAGFFHAIGKIDLRLWHAELWGVFASAVWTIAWLLSRLGGSRAWVVPVAVVALSGTALGNVTLGDADVTMAVFVGCATLALGLWIDSGERRNAILGGLLLGAAINVKNEGLVLSVAVIVAAAVVALRGASPARRRDIALAAGIAVACALPWQLYVSRNAAAERATPAPWKLFSDPGYFTDRLSFLWRGLGQVAARLVEAPVWGLLTPAFLVVAISLLRARARRPVAAFYLAAWFLAALGVGYGYWVTAIGDLDAFEVRTGPRLVLGVALIAGAGLAHLLQIALSDRRAEGPLSSDPVPGA